MTERFETEIRQALDAKAYEVEVPADLAARTMEAVAATDVRQPLVRRLRVRRDARRMRAPVTGYPRWLIGTGALAGAAALLVVGTFVTMPREGAEIAQSRTSVGEEEGYDFRAEREQSLLPLDDQSGQAGSGDAVAGAVAAGDASTDAEGRSVMDLPALSSVGAGGEVAPDPQLVRSADIRVAVGDFDDAWNAAHDIAADRGGRVINLRTEQGEEGIAQGTLRIRVPSAELDALLTDLRRLGTLASLRTTGDDIAEDIEATKKKLAAQRKAHAEATSAGERDRADALERDVNRLERKQDDLENKVEFSFVNATLYQDEAAAERDSTMIGTAARTSGKLALTVLAGIVVVAGILAPLALVALVVWLVLRLFRRRRGD